MFIFGCFPGAETSHPDSKPAPVSGGVRQSTDDSLPPTPSENHLSPVVNEEHNTISPEAGTAQECDDERQRNGGKDDTLGNLDASKSNLENDNEHRDLPLERPPTETKVPDNEVRVDTPVQNGSGQNDGRPEGRESTASSGVNEDDKVTEVNEVAEVKEVAEVTAVREVTEVAVPNDENRLPLETKSTGERSHCHGNETAHVTQAVVSMECPMEEDDQEHTGVLSTAASSSDLVKDRNEQSEAASVGHDARQEEENRDSVTLQQVEEDKEKEEKEHDEADEERQSASCEEEKPDLKGSDEERPGDTSLADIGAGKNQSSMPLHSTQEGVHGDEGRDEHSPVGSDAVGQRESVLGSQSYIDEESTNIDRDNEERRSMHDVISGGVAGGDSAHGDSSQTEVDEHQYSNESDWESSPDDSDRGGEDEGEAEGQEEEEDDGEEENEENGGSLGAENDGERTFEQKNTDREDGEYLHRDGGRSLLSNNDTQSASDGQNAQRSAVGGDEDDGKSNEISESVPSPIHGDVEYCSGSDEKRVFPCTDDTHSQRMSEEHNSSLVLGSVDAERRAGSYGNSHHDVIHIDQTSPSGENPSQPEWNEVADADQATAEGEIPNENNDVAVNVRSQFNQASDDLERHSLHGNHGDGENEQDHYGGAVVTTDGTHEGHMSNVDNGINDLSTRLDRGEVMYEQNILLETENTKKENGGTAAGQDVAENDFMPPSVPLSPSLSKEMLGLSGAAQSANPELSNDPLPDVSF